LAEVAEKMRTKTALRKWLKLTDTKIDRFLSRLPKLCPPTAGILTAEGAVPADPKDDKVVAAAVECGAGYIVSEDRHLDLRECHGIQIMSREEFEAELDRLGVPLLRKKPKRKGNK
jgi:predicted nucleic acid-binding protein